jgi:hypothetical protein
MTGCDFGREVSQHGRWFAPDSWHVLDVSGTSDRNNSGNVTFCGSADQLHAGIR